MRFLKITTLCLLISVCLLPVIYPKDKDVKEPPKTKVKLSPELETKVKDAVELGTRRLLGLVSTMKDYNYSLTDYRKVQHVMRFDDLVLYTLSHCGVGDTTQFNDLLIRVLDMPLDRTYHVTLQAMALNSIDKIKYQAKIADCAQFLIDNQCGNGQWSYGTEMPAENWKKIIYGKTVVTGTGKDSGQEKKDLQVTKSTKVGGYKIVKGRPLGGPAGDNSNTQYAILGLKACKESFVTIQDDPFKMAKRWLESSQDGDGGWAYCSEGQVGGTPAYGSMTLGAIGSLYIAKFYLNEINPGQKDKSIDKGIKWLINNYSVTLNPKADKQEHYYYYLYAMERLGVFMEMEKFGDHNWYVDGCEEIVKRQSPDGLWDGKIADSCFCLLFLKMATKAPKRVITGQ